MEKPCARFAELDRLVAEPLTADPEGDALKDLVGEWTLRKSGPKHSFWELVAKPFLARVYQGDFPPEQPGWCWQISAGDVLALGQKSTLDDAQAAALEAVRSWCADISYSIQEWPDRRPAEEPTP